MKIWKSARLAIGVSFCRAYKGSDDDDSPPFVRFAVARLDNDGLRKWYPPDSDFSWMDRSKSWWKTTYFTFSLPWLYINSAWGGRND